MTTQNFVNDCDLIRKEDFNILREPKNGVAEEESTSNLNRNNKNMNNNYLKKEGSNSLKDSDYLFKRKNTYLDTGCSRRENLSLNLIKENFRILSYKQPRNIEFIRSFFILKGVEKSEERDLTGNLISPKLAIFSEYR